MAANIKYAFIVNGVRFHGSTGTTVKATATKETVRLKSKVYEIMDMPADDKKEIAIDLVKRRALKGYRKTSDDYVIGKLIDTNNIEVISLAKIDTPFFDDYYLTKYSPNPARIRMIRRTINDFCFWVREVEDIHNAYGLTIKHVRKFLKHCEQYGPYTRLNNGKVHIVENSKKGLATSSLNSKQSELKSFYKYLNIESGGRVPLYTDKMYTTDVTEASRVHLTKAELDSIEEKIKEQPLWLQGAFMAARYTGARLVDCCRFGSSKIIEVKGHKYLRFIPRKTRKKKEIITVPIHPTYLAFLEEHGDWDHPKRFFADLYSHHVTEEKIVDRMHQYEYNKKVSQDFLKFLSREMKMKTQADNVAGSNKKNILGFHAIRHSFAKNLADNGVRPQAIQEVLGHEGISMTMHYIGAMTEKGLDNLRTELF